MPASPRQVLVLVAVLSAAATIYWSNFPWLFPLLILLGGLTTLAWNWKKDLAVKVRLQEGCMGCMEEGCMGAQRTRLITLAWKRG